MKKTNRSAILLFSIFWIVVTSSYFLFSSMGFALSPISEGGLNSLLTIYIPVLLLSVFLLLYLTRKRERVDWVELYARCDGICTYNSKNKSSSIPFLGKFTSFSFFNYSFSQTTNN